MIKGLTLYRASARLTSSNGSLSMAINDLEPGTIRIGMAGGEPVPAETVLLTLVLESDVMPGVTLQQVSFNESALTALASTDLGALDADGDGLLDADESDYLNTSSSEIDSDHDGDPDYFEVIAGTDPANGLDRFALRVIYSGGQAPPCLLNWPTKPGRTYTVEQALSPAGPWNPTHEAIGDGTLHSLGVSDDEPHEFFRVRIRLNQ